MRLQFYDHDTEQGFTTDARGVVEPGEWFELGLYLDWQPPRSTRVMVVRDGEVLADRRELHTTTEADVYWAVGNGSEPPRAQPQHPVRRRRRYSPRCRFPLSPQFVRFFALVSAACGGWASSALAAPPERLTLTSNSSCPSAEEVARELTPLLPHTQVSVAEEATPSSDLRASIRDDGKKMRVRVGTDERVFSDPQRSCSERARASAVFIGLVLDPPMLPEPGPVRAPPPVPSRPAAPAPAPPEGPHLTLELGPLLEAAPISDAATVPIAGGFGSRLSWGRGLGVAIGAAFLLPTRLQLPAADARLVWLPFDVSLRASREVSPVTLAAELGPELALLFASGDRVVNPRTSTRLELGARGALSLTWGMSRHLGAFTTLFGVWRPKPYELVVNPGVHSGTTPPLWVGASLGLSLRTR